MSTDVRSVPGSRTGARVAPVLMLVFAVGTFVSSACSQAFGGSFTTADRAGEPTIVPAGYTFAIWGVIQLFALGWAVWVLWFRRRDSALVDRLSVPLAIVFAGFSVWLVAAELEPNWATLAVFVVMAVAMLKAMSIALAERSTIAAWPRLGQVLFWVTLGLYLGWSTAAIWLNLTTALAASGAPIDGTAGFIGQLAILAGVTGSAVVILAWTSGLLPYALAVCWALVGVVNGANGAGQPGLAIAAWIGLALVAVTTIVLQVRRRRT